MANRDSCVFYASWLDAVETMPEAVHGEALIAVLRYALRGETTEKQGAMTKLLMAMVKPQIEANIARWENGRKGGRPKSEKPNGNQTETKSKPNGNQNETYNVNVNDNVNVNVNVNDNERECDSLNAHPRTLTHEEQIFNNFISWCEEHAPSVNKFREPLTLDQFVWLATTYKTPLLKRCAAELHNKDAHKKNVRAITAWKSFMEKLV